MNKKSYIQLFFILMSILLSGCAQVVSNTTVFHQLQSNQKYSFVFDDSEHNNNDLEYSSYKQKIKQKLEEHNFIEKSDSNDLIVKFSYGIDNGKTGVASMPIMGQTGVSSSYTTGTVSTYGNYGSFNATTYNTPTYGVVGSMPYSYTHYQRFLILQMFDNNKNMKYQSNTTSKGASNQIAQVIDEMLEALFEDFPGKSGSTRTSSVRFTE